MGWSCRGLAYPSPVTLDRRLGQAAMATLEEAKQFLQRDAGGRNLYDHLSDVLLKVKGSGSPLTCHGPPTAGVF
jgi:hypothetical protein